MKPCTDNPEAGDDLAYLRHADAQSDAAALAWPGHVAGLSEADRREYEEKGLLESAGKESAGKKRAWKRAAPAEERACLREMRSPEAEQPDRVLWQKEAKRQDAPLVATRFVLAAIIDAHQPRLEASLIAVALGIGTLQNITPAGIAAAYRLGEQVVNKRVCAWTVKLGLARVDLTLPRYVVAHVLEDPRPRLQADCFALAFDFPLRQGMSERELAKRYGVTVAALSARVLWWVGELAARLPGVCKKRTAGYRDANVRRQPDNPFRLTA